MEGGGEAMGCSAWERLTFMVRGVREELEELGELEERDGTSTVNGPDVVRISKHPCSGWGSQEREREHQNRWGDPREWD